MIRRRCAQLFEQLRIEFLQRRYSMEMVCRNPRQPFAVRSNSSAGRSGSEAEVFLLPPDPFHIVLASGNGNHRLGVMQQDSSDLKVMRIVGVFIKPRIRGYGPVEILVGAAGV